MFGLVWGWLHFRWLEVCGCGGGIRDDDGALVRLAGILSRSFLICSVCFLLCSSFFPSFHDTRDAVTISGGIDRWEISVGG